MLHHNQNNPVFIVNKTAAGVLNEDKQCTYATKIQAAFSSSNLNDALEVMTELNATNTKNSTPLPPIKYPVFQGGGAKGVAYVGAFAALEAQGYLDEIVCPGGTSAGAIPAFFMGLGFTSDQFAYISEHMNFMDFLDLKKDGWGAYLNGSKIGIAADLVCYGAASSGLAFHQMASYYVEQVLGDKNATFRDLHEKKTHDPALKDMLFTATHYGDSTHAQQVFSYEQTPDVLIADALRATMSYPGAFEPWQVRQKVFKADNTYELKSLGFFADGGILNNLPLTVYNTQTYSDPRFQSIERMDKYNNPVQVNPCVVGFSLTGLEALDETITPMSARVRFLHNLSTLDKSADAKPVSATERWHFIDILKAGYWSMLGKRVVEDITDKQKVYKDQIVQIWPDEISTLEFDIAKDKQARSVDNGKEATQLWLQKFHNPQMTSCFEDSFNPKLTKKEQILKAANPGLFYHTQLKALYIEFRAEMEKQVQRGQTDNQMIAQNVNLQYLSARILKINAKLKEKNMGSIVDNAFAEACKIYTEQSVKIKQNRDSRWALIKPEKIINNICQKAYSEPEVALRMLEGQLTNLISLVKKNNGKLMRGLVRTNNTDLVSKALAIMLNTLNQSYYQSRIQDPKKKLARLLNNINPSLIKMALLRHNAKLALVLADYGVNMIDVVRKEADIIEELHQGIASLHLDEKPRVTGHQQAIIFSKMAAANVHSFHAVRLNSPILEDHFPKVEF